MLFKKKKLFGSSILPSCDYCEYATFSDADVCECSQDMEITELNSCKKFKYNPLMRTPVTRSIRLPEYKPEDFIL